MREDMPLLGRWIARAFQRYWRVVRGLYLSVEACVIDEAGLVLMVRDENGGSWELPEGRVKKDEALETALARVLRDTVGIQLSAKPELSFFHARTGYEQTGLYIVRNWRRMSGPSREIGFFAYDSLPADTPPRTAGRIRRSLEDRTTSEV